MTQQELAQTGQTYAPINLKQQHPPGHPPPGHLNFWRLDRSISLPSGQKSCSNAPPISTEIPLLISSSIETLFTERYVVMTPSNFFRRPFWKSYSLTRAKFCLVNPSNLAKTEIITREYYARTRNKSGSNSPPFKGNVQIPPFLSTMHSHMPGVCPGGCWSFDFDRRISLNLSWGWAIINNKAIQTRRFRNIIAMLSISGQREKQWKKYNDHVIFINLEKRLQN